MPKRNSRTIWLGLAGAAICAAAIWGAYAYWHRPAVIKPTPVNTSQGNQNGKQPPASAPVTQNTGSDTSKGTGSGSGPSPTALAPPSGSFVSNHKPNLGSSPAPNTEESTCIVQQGASCNISFTKGSTTLSLGAQTAGANGIVAWHWSLQGLGVTQGNWAIKAVATLGNQTQSTTDPLPLDVQP